MAKGIRAPYLLANFMNTRPEHESCEEFSHRIGLSYTLDTANLLKRKDVHVGLLYRVCKAFGYQIIIYNPNPPKPLQTTYVIGEGKTRVLPREIRGYYKVQRDSYTGEIKKVPSKGRKRKKKFIKVA